MRIEATVKHIQAREEVSATGIILDLPIERFQDGQPIQLAFQRLLRQSVVYCEYGNPDLGDVTYDRVVETISRMKTIEMSRVCGVITNAMVEIRDEERVLVTATFTPAGPYKDVVVDLMKSSGQLCLGARFLLNEEGKIFSVPTWDVVPEVPEKMFSFGLTLKNQ